MSNPTQKKTKPNEFQRYLKARNPLHRSCNKKKRIDVSLTRVETKEKRKGEVEVEIEVEEKKKR